MSKIIRLTESDLVKLVKRVINEQDNRDYYTQFTKEWAFKNINNDPSVKLLPTSTGFEMRCKRKPSIHAFFDKRYPKVVQVQGGPGGFKEFDLKTLEGYNAATEYLEQSCGKSILQKM
jgi:hypothetical protein